MSTETDNKLDGAPEPFRRPVVWGRPPQTVFRAGPLPKGGRLPPLPEPPRRAAGSGILSGSMIPRPAPQPAAPAPAVAHAPAPAPEPAPVDAAADLAVRPLPAPEPEPAPGRISTPPPRTEPRTEAHPAPVVAPIASPARASVDARRMGSRAPLYAGIAAAAVGALAFGGWMLTRGPSEAPVGPAPVSPVEFAPP
ncbi:MAG: hypothetical protein U1E18_22245, partial [Brevundimonas sp.]|nr:hypothetical protein [Brevundimonas sp.]